MKCITTSLFFLFLAHFLFAQEISGKLITASDKKPLSYATVSVYKAADTTLIAFKVSDTKGEFKVTGLPINVNLRMIITMTGYGVYRKELMLTENLRKAELGTIEMAISSITLNEVLVRAEIPPVVMRHDTLEFNASSFKTLPNALVEDLFKKLPGFRVSADGDISVNGKPMNKILVDSREFFGDDPKVASRNLPSAIVDKVQVIKDPDFVRLNPDVPDNQIPMVINLKLKKEIKKGLFGKLYGGGGIKDKYEGGGILNMFTDTTHLSILGYTNNLNKAGFGAPDIARIGGVSANMSVASYFDGGVAIDNISFGGTGQGVQQSAGAGANLNTIISKKVTLTFNYFYGVINADLQQLLNSNQTLPAGPFITSTNRDQDSRNSFNRFGAKMRWKLNPFTTLDINPSMTLKNSNASQTSLFNTFDGSFAPVSNSTNNQKNGSDGSSYASTVSLSRSFKKKGRSFSYSGNFSRNSDNADQYNIASNYFNSGSTTTNLNQLRGNNTSNYLMTNSLSYTEPVNKFISTIFSASSDHFNNSTLINTFDYDPVAGKYIIPKTLFSDDFDRDGSKNRYAIALRSIIKKITLRTALTAITFNADNHFLKTAPIKQNYFYLAPSASLAYKQFDFSYSANIREPNAADLQPVSDNTNPLYIVTGNPALKPTVSNSFSIYYNKADQKHATNYYISFDASTEKNSIVRDRTVAANGVQTTKPVNVSGVWTAGTYYTLTKDYKLGTNRKLSIGHSMQGTFRHNSTLLNSVSSDVNTLSLYPSMETRLNLNDVFELTEVLRYSFQKINYEAFVNDISLRSYSSQTEAVLRFPKRVVWESSFIFRHSANTSPGFQKNSTRLNGALSYLFMKKDRAQLKFSMYDIMDQNITAYRSIRENIIEDLQQNALTRYGMLTFTYNIQNFGGKVGGGSIFTLFR